MFGDSDLGVFVNDFGTPVSFRGTTAKCIQDTMQDVYAHGGGPGKAARTTILVRIPYNAFTPMPKERDPIQVNGINYTVLELPEQRDVQFTDYHLKLA